MDKADKSFSHKINAEREMFIEKFKNLKKEAGNRGIYFSFETGKLFIVETEDSDDSDFKRELERFLMDIAKTLFNEDNPRKKH